MRYPGLLSLGGGQKRDIREEGDRDGREGRGVIQEKEEIDT